VRLFYQSLGASRRSIDGPYAQKLAAILNGAAAPGTMIEVHGLAPGKAIADQYRYLECSGLARRRQYTLQYKQLIRSRRVISRCRQITHLVDPRARRGAHLGCAGCGRYPGLIRNREGAMRRYFIGVGLLTGGAIAVSIASNGSMLALGGFFTGAGRAD
jgi:hypothetical protein